MPILRQYLDGFFIGFDEKLKDGRPRSLGVEFMARDGGLLDLTQLYQAEDRSQRPRRRRIGYALTSWGEENRHPITGLDVGNFYRFSV